MDLSERAASRVYPASRATQASLDFLAQKATKGMPGRKAMSATLAETARTAETGFTWLQAALTATR